MTPTNRPPTIRDVARHAGVSKSLVSLVLNGSPLVRPDKRAAVQASVRALGYRPNTAARRLTGRSLGTVGVLIHDLRQAFHEDLVETLNAGFHEHDMTMLLGDARLDRRADERLVNAFMNMRVDGLVVVGSMVPSADVAEAVTRIPSVVVASLDVLRPRVDVSVQDDELGARLATEHLLGLGHRRVAHVSGAVGASLERRRESYRATMLAAGLAPEVVVDDLTEDGAYRAATALLSRPARPTGVPARPTGVFAAADSAAVGVLRAASDLGLRVPRDLSVIGFDNASVSRSPGVELSTVDIDLDALVGTAIRLLRERIEDPTRRRRLRRTTPRVVVRRTTAEPAPDR